jgi:hypothetical protein
MNKEVFEFRKNKLFNSVTDKGFGGQLENKLLSLRKDKNEKLISENRTKLMTNSYKTNIKDIRNLNNFLKNELTNQVNEFILSCETLDSIVVFIIDNKKINFDDVENLYNFVLNNLTNKAGTILKDENETQLLVKLS